MSGVLSANHLTFQQHGNEHLGSQSRVREMRLDVSLLLIVTAEQLIVRFLALGQEAKP
jgi:hypothetical protein